MTTVLDLITNALKDLGAIAIGEAPTDAEAADALDALNGMLETWNTESLMIYNIQQEEFPYVPDQGVYTIGPGGDFDTDRPVTIEAAYNRDNDGNDYAITVTTDWELYSSIISKYVTTSLVTVLYDNGNYPLKSLYLWPVPSDGTYSIVLWMWKPISSFTSISDTVTLPPGYKRAIEKNLSIELSPRYGRPVSAELAKAASESKAQLMRINTTIQTMKFDPTLTHRGRVFNWLTGQ